MNSLADLQRKFNDYLLAQDLGGSPPELYEPIRYFLSFGGKRMRPALLLAGCELFGMPADHALPQALAIEIFHNFTLMHDDIMDQAPFRRGNQTVHEKWNTNTAILSGDVMLVQAYRYLMQSEEPVLKRILSLFNETAILVCEGQQLDMNFETQETPVSVEDYLEMIEKKTAVLLAAALQTGAILGGAANEQAEMLYAFGKHIGLAFQLRDDWLDTFGEEIKTGKQAGGDIARNKKTFLVIEALDRAGKEEKERLLTLFTGNTTDIPAKVMAVKAIFQQLDIENITLKEIERHYGAAIGILSRIPVPESRKEVLFALAHMVIRREQ